MWELLDVARSWHQHPVTLMLHCGDHRLHTWHNQGFQFQLALCGTYRLHFAVWCSRMVNRKGSCSNFSFSFKLELQQKAVLQIVHLNAFSPVCFTLHFLSNQN